MSSAEQQNTHDTPSARTSPGLHRDPPSEAPVSVQVWDLAVRIFHWSLVACVLAAWWTGGSGHRAHEILGYTVLGLIAFRFAWGFGGTRHARFTDFLHSPQTIIAYLRSLTMGAGPRYVGHNPAGGAMIAALLGTLLALSITGWLMLTRRLFGVPWVEDVHSFAADALLILIALHVCGVIGSSVLHRENLVLSMLTGRKLLDKAEAKQEFITFRPGVPDATATRIVAQGLILLVLLAGIGFAYGWRSTAHRSVVPATTETGAR